MDRLKLVVLLVILTVNSVANSQTKPIPISVGNEIKLHYVERGQGEPIVFVHGAIGDYSDWTRQLESFAKEGYRAISYSRRYNYPNDNELRPGDSKASEAGDLVALIRALGLKKTHLVGFSAGAYISLVAALEHPDLFQTLTLAEPPLPSWLASRPRKEAGKGLAYLKRVSDQRVAPVERAFEAGDERAAVRAFVDSFGGKGAFDGLPKVVQENRIRNARELRAIVAIVRSYPHVDRERVRQMKVPTLVLSADKSNATSTRTDPELTELLPRKTSKRVMIKGARHIMWVDQPEQCEKAVLEFIRAHKSSVSEDS